ncbi:ABC transporter ATP-binding protein [Bacteroidia bacterium]|nr:ABC transporter ATP-binding protein [Bacteroidia bacterium]
MKANLIKKVNIAGLFHKYDVEWNLNPDVNILVGINGSGKSTILKSINALLSQKYADIKDRVIDVEIILTDDNKLICNSSSKSTKNPLDYDYITTFDVPLRDKTKIKQGETPLDKELQSLIFPTAKDTKAFLNYRLKATASLDLANQVNNNIKKLFAEIDKLFSETNKKVEIDPINNSLRFRFEDSTTVELEQLSAGEKQLLIILFTVFLMEEKPTVLIMDEPEISLHIGWQQQLIDVIRQLNPNCQLIIATHSPSIFGEGWGDKVFFVKDLTQKI